MSVLIGAFFGLGISFFFKKFNSFNEYPLRETSIILLTGYISYLVAEICNLSGIKLNIFSFIIY